MAIAAIGVAALGWWQQQLRRPAPTATHEEPPSHLDRNDFRSPESPWLIAVFTSATCASCAAVWTELSAHESADVVVQELEAKIDADVHRRYSIEDVPAAVLVDTTGHVHHAVVGPLSPADRESMRAILLGNA